MIVLVKYYQSNVFIKPFLHQPMSKCYTEIQPKTASNVEAWCLGKTPWEET